MGFLLPTLDAGAAPTPFRQHDRKGRRHHARHHRRPVAVRQPQRRVLPAPRRPAARGAAHHPQADHHEGQRGERHLLRGEDPAAGRAALRGRYRDERGDCRLHDEGGGDLLGRGADDHGDHGELRPRDCGEDQASGHGAGFVSEEVGPWPQGHHQEGDDQGRAVGQVREGE